MVAKPLQRDFTQFSHYTSHGVSAAPSRQSGQVQSGEALAASATVAEQAIVLRTLIEEFGGEVVGSALAWRLVRLHRWSEAEADPLMRKVLHELEQSGAISLEDLDGTDLVARIESVGVTVAYEARASSNVLGLGAASQRRLQLS